LYFGTILSQTMASNNPSTPTNSENESINLTPFVVSIVFICHHIDNIIAHINLEADDGEQIYALSNVSIVIVTGVYPSSQAITQNVIAMYGPIAAQISGLISLVMASSDGAPRRVMLSTVLQILWTQYIRSHTNLNASNNTPEGA